MAFVQLDLEQLSDEEFRSYVDRYIRNELEPEIAEALETPPLVNRLATALERMIVKVDSQMQSRSDDIAILEAEREAGGGVSDSQLNKAIADYTRWRASALRFRGYIEETQVKVKDLLVPSRVAELEEAIREHRRSVERGDDSAVADVALWEHLTR